MSEATDYTALRRHIADEHPPGSGLSLYLRNDVLAERHNEVCDFRAARTSVPPSSRAVTEDGK